MQALIRSKSAGITGGRGTAGAGPYYQGLALIGTTTADTTPRHFSSAHYLRLN